MKVYDYILVLKDSGHRLINNISKMMLVLAIAVIGFSAFLHFTTASLLSLGLLIIIVGWWIYIYLQSKKGNSLYDRIALLFAAVAWYLQPGGKWMALIYMLAALLEKQVKFPRELAFDAEEIVINSLPKKYIAWQDMRNVVLKDGLLTLDFKNNKLVQHELSTATAAQVENEFNAFCHQHLRP